MLHASKAIITKNASFLKAVFALQITAGFVLKLSGTLCVSIVDISEDVHPFSGHWLTKHKLFFNTNAAIIFNINPDSNILAFLWLLLPFLIEEWTHLLK